MIEHDGCVNCEYEALDAGYMPCVKCKGTAYNGSEEHKKRRDFYTRIDNKQEYYDTKVEACEMTEKRYRVLVDRHEEIATGMSLEMALLFVKAYVHEFWQEVISLTIEELQPCRNYSED